MVRWHTEAMLLHTISYSYTNKLLCASPHTVQEAGPARPKGMQDFRAGVWDAFHAGLDLGHLQGGENHKNRLACTAGKEINKQGSKPPQERLKPC